ALHPGQGPRRGDDVVARRRRRQCVADEGRQSRLDLVRGMRGGAVERTASPVRRTVIDSIRPASLAFLVGPHPQPVTNEEVRLMAEPESPEAVPAERI